MTVEILIIDDEEEIRTTLGMILGRKGWQSHQAATIAEAMQQMEAHSDIGVVMVDIRLGKQSGLDCIARMTQESERKPEYIVITGDGGVEEAVKALRLGAADFLLKPFRLRQVLDSVEMCAERYGKRQEQSLFSQRVTAEIRSRDQRIHELAKDVDIARIETLQTLATAAEQRDNETGAHIRRIGAYAKVFAEALDWNPDAVERIGQAAQLHDIGKIGVPDRILLKPGPLTAAEMKIIRNHTVIGSQIIGAAHGKVMQSVSNIAMSHHECWDGTGYPNAIRGNDIPLESRIVAICDVYDALRSERPYKPSFDHETAKAVIVNGDERTHPSQFDPELLEIFKEKNDAFRKLFDLFEDREPALLVKRDAAAKSTVPPVLASGISDRVGK